MSAPQLHGWIPVLDSLPMDWVEVDDKPCRINGKPIGAMYRGPEVLVSLSSGDVQIDETVRIGEYGNVWWSRYGARVTHWQRKPPAARGNELATGQMKQAHNITPRQSCQR